MDIVRKKCLCGNQVESWEFTIECSICKILCHGRCVAMKEYISTEVDKFHCPQCCNKYGPSIMKKKTNFHRHDYSEEESDKKPVQTGTPVFIRELRSRHFPGASDVVRYLDGQLLTFSYLQKNGFEIPIIVNNKESLDMDLPPSSFSLHDIENYIGGDYEMDVIDVAKQNNVRMNLSEFVEYFNDPHRSRILNVISLEISNTGLSPLIKAPHIARELDWANYIWPQDWPDNSELKRPEVQKYCLIGVRDSFTDFHIDFGGTSVWYHVLRGEKIFYIIEPTQANLHLYQQWMCSSTQSETFFGDQVDACYKCVLKEGQTMMIPTGWIHAVLTPIDSLVFGGNFIHSLNIPMQLQVYEMEKKMKTPAKFQYPCFESIHWFAAKCLLKELKNLNSEEKKCPPYLLRGLKALLTVLKQWNTDKDYNMLSRSQIPTTINSHRLLKDLSKEIRYADKFLMSINPPKPERESQRRKKKMYNSVLDLKVIDRIASDHINDHIKTENLMENFISTEDNSLLDLKFQNKFQSKKNVPSFSTLIASNKKSKKRPLNQSSFMETPCSQTFYDVKCLQDKTCLKNIQTKNNSMICLDEPQTTLIRFKLDDKESLNSRNNNDNIKDNFKQNHATKVRKRMPWIQTSSVYDFHDGSNDSDNKLAIVKVQKTKSAKCSKSIQQEHQLNSNKLENPISVPKNGIEELLKASAYASVPDTKLNIAASPSTRDAIAGMLSFSVQCYSTNSEIIARSSKTVRSNNSSVKKDDGEEDDFLLDNTDEVHQDDDFIYPALEVSDEDECIFQLKGKKKDEAWNPKAKLGSLFPKMNRPTRINAKKTSVEKGLQAAAKKLAKNYCTNRLSRIIKDKKSAATERYKASKKKVENTSNQNVDTIETQMLSDNLSIHTHPTILTKSHRLEDVKAKLAAPISVDRRPKKGMKTVKQRLGKILKIHRMIY